MEWVRFRAGGDNRSDYQYLFEPVLRTFPGEPSVFSMNNAFMTGIVDTKQRITSD
jgi:hypothetical protein